MMFFDVFCNLWLVVLTFVGDFRFVSKLRQGDGLTGVGKNLPQVLPMIRKFYSNSHTSSNITRYCSCSVANFQQLVNTKPPRASC